MTNSEMMETTQNAVFEAANTVAQVVENVEHEVSGHGGAYYENPEFWVGLAFVLVVLAAVVCLASCNGTQPIAPSSFEKLPAPADIAVQFNRITWESVDGCVGYAVDYNGEITEVSDAFYESSYQPYYDDLKIKVKALGDNVYYEDSDWAEYVIEYEQPTEGLRYMLVEGGWGYEVTRPDENDVNKGLEGRVVIPDFYNDLPVVRIAESMFCRQVFNGYIYNDVTTSVRFPRFLEQIGSDAFRGLQKLTSISLPRDGSVPAPQIISALLPERS